MKATTSILSLGRQSLGAAGFEMAQCGVPDANYHEMVFWSLHDHDATHHSLSVGCLLAGISEARCPSDHRDSTMSASLDDRRARFRVLHLCRQCLEAQGLFRCPQTVCRIELVGNRAKVPEEASTQ
jgi:hypothetical protein